MPLRKQILATGEIYHVVNRGVASTPIFKSSRDYQRFIELVDYYRFGNHKISFSKYKSFDISLRKDYFDLIKKQNEQRIEIQSYCLMPNHIHFLIKQMKDGGIRDAFSDIQNAYAKYFNLRNKRLGPLFQSRFRAVRVESDETYLHVSRYIHLNPCTSYMVEIKDLDTFKWSSYQEFIGVRKSIFTETAGILNLVGSIKKYKSFVINQADYQRELNKVKHLMLDE